METPVDDNNNLNEEINSQGMDLYAFAYFFSLIVSILDGKHRIRLITLLIKTRIVLIHILP